MNLKGMSGAVDNSKYVIEANRLYEQGNYESAAAFYEKGLDKSIPFVNEDFVMYRLGDCYLLSERYEEALKVFQTLNSDYINSSYQFKSRLKTGECYAALGEYKKARKTLYSIVAQEGKCCSDDDKLTVVDSYYKIAEYYMQEAERLRKVAAGGPGYSDRPLALK
ncbi:proton-dependent oligopeptide transporter POT family [Candidatus Brocadia sinica JPN1]|uniref:Proton-dependent oligopeptide transporter POT family n=1 Tax=Candidatus Brocadia sinica JPN1 TaxID=1197129 RepID=A0ABQ0JZI1_9BACT|nr:proton-dependent oligopeptide transporter POT family [Candidatus Brocadia sinica JPN1]